MRRRALVAGGFGVLAFATSACAQFGGAASGRHGGMRGGGSGRSAREQSRESPDVLQVSLEELYVDLELTAEQQPRWNAYREKVEALAGDIARERKRAGEGGESRNAVQQLNRLVDAQRDRLAAMEEIAEAGSALYASLTAQQKQLADRRLAQVMSAMGAADRPEARRAAGRT